MARTAQHGGAKGRTVANKQTKAAGSNHRQKRKETEMSKASKRIRELHHSMPMDEAISFATAEQLERIADALEKQSAGKVTIDGEAMLAEVKKSAVRQSRPWPVLRSVDQP